MMQDWEIERLRRETRNPAGNLRVRPPLYIEGGEVVLRLSKKSALSAETDGLTVHLDPSTLSLEKGSPWRITAKPVAEAAPKPRSGPPRALTFLGW